MPFNTLSKGKRWVIQGGADSAGSPPASYTTVGYGTNDTLTEDFEVTQVSHKSSTSTSSSIGAASWQHSFEGFYVPGDDGQELVKAAIAMQKTPSTAVAYHWRFVMVDESGDPITGAPVFTGQAWITSRSIGAPDAEDATLSLTFTGTGALTEGVVSA